MSAYRYVLLDPTGNITALVLDPVPPEDRAEVTGRLLAESEQVAFLEGPARAGALAGIRLMGGEFCGNAAMAAAAWLVRERLRPGEETVVPLDVSGAEETVECRIRAAEDGFTGTVRMPDILGIRKTETEGFPLTMVRMEGILHMILEGEIPGKEEAEALLRRIAQARPAEKAAGLLQWDGRKMRPLVYVPGSGSMVWETGCGSGSAAVGAAEAMKAGRTAATDVLQPGGTIRVTAEVSGGTVRRVWITGRVRIGTESEIQVENSRNS